jgi:hypothetical protein
MLFCSGAISSGSCTTVQPHQTKKKERKERKRKIMHENKHFLQKYSEHNSQLKQPIDLERANDSNATRHSRRTDSNSETSAWFLDPSLFPYRSNKRYKK